MTAPVLQVTPASLRKLAQRCQGLSGQVAPPVPAVSTPAWQVSGAAVSSINTGASKAATAMRERMTASSAKLATAAREYEAMDNDGASALAAVAQGGAGTRRSGPHSGADGGAGGLSIPR
ncbi:type VII secretion target [Mycolicibacter heraklionensis]|uniref:type VII secretion target n=1 Tax=Mycolicibacter heraklionensis TaxID=512402 RepID=UPI0009ED1763|nr:type VII secretion target [Mycolicibacter heraklionensis]